MFFSENCFSYQSPSRYVFHGAEIGNMCKSNSKYEDEGNCTDDKSSDTEELKFSTDNEVEDSFVDNLREDFCKVPSANLPKSTTSKPCSQNSANASHATHNKDCQPDCGTSATNSSITASSATAEHRSVMSSSW